MSNLKTMQQTLADYQALISALGTNDSGKGLLMPDLEQTFVSTDTQVFDDSTQVWAALEALPAVSGWIKLPSKQCVIVAGQWPEKRQAPLEAELYLEDTHDAWRLTYYQHQWHLTHVSENETGQPALRSFTSVIASAFGVKKLHYKLFWEQNVVTGFCITQSVLMGMDIGKGDVA